MPAKKNNKPSPRKKPSQKVVKDAQHTIKFTAPTLVDDPSIVSPEDEALEEEAGEFIEYLEDDEAETRRPPTVRQRLKDKFIKRGIGGTELLKVRIDRLPSFEQDGMAGVKADKKFCGVFTVTDSFFDNDEYLIKIQQSYGPGDYWITVRHKNTIVQQWQESIGGFAMPTTGGETAQPGQTIIYTQPGQPTNQGKQPDGLGELRRAFQIVKEFRSELGITGPQNNAPAPQPPALDPETAFLQGLAHNDKFMDKIKNSAIKNILGSNAGDDDPSIAAVAMEMVKSGQAAAAIEAFGQIALSIVDRIIPKWGNSNGQPPMATQTVQDQSQPTDHGQGQIVPLSRVQAGSQASPGQQPQTDGSAAGRRVDARRTAPNASPSQTAPPQGQQPTLMEIVQRLPIAGAFQLVTDGRASADNIALAKVLDGCVRKTSPEGVVDWIFQFADQLNEQLPDHSIDLYINSFALMTTDQAMAFVDALPNGNQITKLDHARAWTEELQRIIKESQTEEEGQD